MQFDYRHRVLAIAAGANFAQFGARLVFSPLVTDVGLAFEVSRSTVGVLLTGVWVAFALAQYPSGVLADRYGERAVILVAMAATALASLGLAFAPSLLTFAVAAIALGGGAGLYFSVGTALLTRLFESRSTALGIHSGGGTFAGFVVPALVTAIALQFHWQDAFLLSAGIATAVFLLVAIGVESTPPPNPRAPLRTAIEPRRIARLLATREVRVTLLLSIVGMFTFQSVVSFYPTFLTEYWQLSDPRASTLFGIIFALFAVSLSAQGRLADVVSRDGVLIGAFLCTALGFVVGLASGVPGGPVLSIALLGLGMGWGGVIQARFMAGFDAADRGAGFGLVRTIFVGLGAAGNTVTGYLSEAVNWAAAYGLVAALLVLAAGIVVLENRSRPTDRP